MGTPLAFVRGDIQAFVRKPVVVFYTCGHVEIKPTANFFENDNDEEIENMIYDLKCAPSSMIECRPYFSENTCQDVECKCTSVSEDKNAIEPEVDFLEEFISIFEYNMVDLVHLINSVDPRIVHKAANEEINGHFTSLNQVFGLTQGQVTSIKLENSGIETLRYILQVLRYVPEHVPHSVAMGLFSRCLSKLQLCREGHKALQSFVMYLKTLRLDFMGVLWAPVRLGEYIERCDGTSGSDRSSGGHGSPSSLVASEESEYFDVATGEPRYPTASREQVEDYFDHSQEPINPFLIAPGTMTTEDRESDPPSSASAGTGSNSPVIVPTTAGAEVFTTNHKAVPTTAEAEAFIANYQQLSGTKSAFQLKKCPNRALFQQRLTPGLSLMQGATFNFSVAETSNVNFKQLRLKYHAAEDQPPPYEFKLDNVLEGPCSKRRKRNGSSDTSSTRDNLDDEVNKYYEELELPLQSRKCNMHQRS